MLQLCGLLNAIGESDEYRGRVQSGVDAVLVLWGFWKVECQLTLTGWLLKSFQMLYLRPAGRLSNSKHEHHLIIWVSYGLQAVLHKC